MTSSDDTTQSEKGNGASSRKWSSIFNRKSKGTEGQEESDDGKSRPTKWSMGVLNDPRTHEVPGSVLLLSGSDRNEPLGLRNMQATTSHSSLPAQFASPNLSRPPTARRPSEGKKKTKDGAIILEPQPDESQNDPLNWPSWKRDTALLSLGLYCMVGGGLTPILAAGYTNVANTYDTTQPKVALTTGLYMMGLGVGSVFASPTAILYGKRPVYMFGALLLIGTSAWCAASPSYNSLLVARVFQGVAVSPVECLPSATIAEIFFLHERAYRIGIYTLLLLGGKNLVPLVSAAIIQSYGWRWVFWIVTMVVGFCLVLLFFFVPETFWDRTPTRSKSRRNSEKSNVMAFFGSRKNSFASKTTNARPEPTAQSKDEEPHALHAVDGSTDDNTTLRRIAAKNASCKNSLHDASTSRRNLHVGFVPGTEESNETKAEGPRKEFSTAPTTPAFDEPCSPFDTRGLGDQSKVPTNTEQPARGVSTAGKVPTNTEQPAKGVSKAGKVRPTLNLGALDNHSLRMSEASHSAVTPVSYFAHQPEESIESSVQSPPTPSLHNFNSPFYIELERSDSDYLSRGREAASGVSTEGHKPTSGVSTEEHEPAFGISADGGRFKAHSPERIEAMLSPVHEPQSAYTAALKQSPRKSFIQQLKPWNGRLHYDNWFRVAIRPFILFAYPAVLWSSIVYSCSVGWLIVLSESVSTVYRSKETYNFSALSTGLIYISPFIGGVLGTGVAGKVSDIIVRAMARRNGGVYEPEFRLVMAAPVAITTVIGLMGFGWSAQVHDNWIVPTIFFGIISFGCSLGSTTAITFVVDSYRQYAGEALVTLNFSKNIFHGLVFSLFFTRWLEADGSRQVFLALGGIQLALLTLSIPMFIFGKRARMWTVRMNLMEKF